MSPSEYFSKSDSRKKSFLSGSSDGTGQDIILSSSEGARWMAQVPQIGRITTQVVIEPLKVGLALPVPGGD